MISDLIVASLLLAPQPAPAQMRPPACTSDKPIVGRLEVARPGLRLHRANKPFLLRAKGQLDLCAYDEVVLEGGNATILISRIATPMKPGRRYSLIPYAKAPTLVRFVADLLNSKWNPLLAASKTATSAGQGDEETIAFRVAGLDDGTAQVAAGERVLQVTFSGSPDTRGALVGPGNRTIAGKPVRTTRFQAPRLLFPKVNFQAGELWAIRLSSGATTVSGSFRIVEGPFILPEVRNAPPGQEGRALRALALAGSDPDRWSFEALQHVLDSGATRIRSDDAETMLSAWNVDPSTRPDPR